MLNAQQGRPELRSQRKFTDAQYAEVLDLAARKDELGLSWAKIGAEVGMSRDAAYKIWQRSVGIDPYKRRNNDG